MSKPPIQTKTCKDCGQTKSDHLFYTGRRVCQQCYRSRQTRYYKENTDSIKARVLARYYRSLG